MGKRWQRLSGGAHCPRPSPLLSSLVSALPHANANKKKWLPSWYRVYVVVVVVAVVAVVVVVVVVCRSAPPTVNDTNPIVLRRNRFILLGSFFFLATPIPDYRVFT